MKILITTGEGFVKDTFFPPEIIAEIEKLGHIIYNNTGRDNFTKEELCENIKDVDIIFTSWGAPKIDADVLMYANKLKIHAHTGGSVAGVTSKEEYDKGIIVLCGNDIFAKSVAEGCLCYTLMALRKTIEYSSIMKNDGWRVENWQTNGLIGKKIGLVGFGTISRYYAKLLQWFNPQLYICSEYISESELIELNAKKATAMEIFENCDVISFHSALNDKTRGRYAKEELSHIKDGALLVNTARAEIFDETALYDELKTGRFNAVLDVYHSEPLPKDSALRNMKNVFLMPHMAGPTTDLRKAVTQSLIDDINRISSNVAPQNAVNYNTAKHMTV